MLQDLDKMKEEILFYLYDRKVNGIQNPLFESDLVRFYENRHKLIAIVEMLDADGFINVKWLPQKSGFAILPLEGHGFKKALELVKEKERQKMTILTVFDKVNYSLYANYMQEIDKIISNLSSRRVLNSSIEVHDLCNAWKDYVKLIIENIMNELKNKNLAYFIDLNNSVIIEKIEELINKAIDTKFYFRGQLTIKDFEKYPNYKNTALAFKNELLEIWNREATLIALNPEINNKEDYKIMNQQNININNTSNDNSNQNVQINIGNINELEKNDVKQLKTLLKEQGLSDKNIDDLETAINSDKKESEQIILGENTKNWIINLTTSIAPSVLQNLPNIVAAVQKCCGG